MTTSITSDRNFDVALRLPATPVLPHPHHSPITVAEVFYAASGSDNGVVSPVIRSEMALLVRNHGSRDLSHHEHREVFNVNDGVESCEGFRRPIVKRKPVTHHAIAALAAAICELSVDHEVPHSDDPLGHRIGEPIHHVNIVCGLL